MFISSFVPIFSIIEKKLSKMKPETLFVLIEVFTFAVAGKKNYFTFSKYVTFNEWSSPYFNLLKSKYFLRQFVSLVIKKFLDYFEAILNMRLKLHHYHGSNNDPCKNDPCNSEDLCFWSIFHESWRFNLNFSSHFSFAGTKSVIKRHLIE